MEAQEYENLVWSLQRQAQDIPGIFQNKVLLISLTAQVVLLGLLLSLTFGLYFTLSTVIEPDNSLFNIFLVSWLIIIGPLVWLIYHIFFTPLPVPQGRELTESEAPQLFRMVSEIQEHLQGAPIHHVLITNEFNAAIAQCPRFGLFGCYKNYLILGLPLMYAVSAEEILAIIAHEYGHLSASHSKLGGWIYRQRVSFDTLYERATANRESNILNGVIAGLLDWFAPYYSAYTFVLSRQSEYEADALASEIAGADVSASALTRINLLSNWLYGSFWPKLYAQAAQLEIPIVMPYVAMRKLLIMTMDEWATPERLNEVWKVKSNVHDTHPCLSDRINALEQTATLPTLPKNCAADVLFGNFAQNLAHEFDEKWWSAEKVKWQKYHHRYNLSQARIAQLSSQPVDVLNVADGLELALLLVEFRSVSEAKLILENLLGRQGERFPKPVYLYGRALLDEGNSNGLGYLEEAFRLSPSMGNDCANAGYHWLCEKQNEAAAESWLDRLRTMH